MYQLMLIASGSDEADNLVSKLEKHFRELSVVGPKLERLGKKTLAYPIHKQTEGEYLLYHFETDGATINQLSDRLRLDQELVLRFLITIYDPTKVSKVASMPDVAKTEELQEKPKPKVTVTTKVVAPKSASVEVPRAKAKAEKKVTKKAKK